jgi:hypothetical protein
VSVYLGLHDEDTAPLAPTAKQIADLRGLDFDILDTAETWSAVRVLDGYRTSITLTRDLAIVSTIRVAGSLVVAVEECDSLDRAVTRVMELALDVSTVLLFGDLILADLRSVA